MEASTKIKLIQVLEKVTGSKLPCIDFNNDILDELDLNSIKIVELFAAIEEEFEIELPLKMMQVKSANDFIEMFDEAISSEVE